MIDQQIENEQLVQDAQSYHGIRRDLHRVKNLIGRGEFSKAVRVVDQILGRLNGDNRGQRFTKIGIVYKTSDPNFRCGFNDQERAKRVGRDAAVNDCYRAGFNSCREVSNVITANGYLGRINGTYYGYGCRAEVVVRGLR